MKEKLSSKQAYVPTHSYCTSVIYYNMPHASASQPSTQILLLYMYCVLYYIIYIFLVSLRPAQSLMRSQLRAGLMQLPAPKNDFEIVVPDMEEMEGGEGEEVRHGYVEDAAEVQERAAALKREEGG